MEGLKGCNIQRKMISNARSSKEAPSQSEPKHKSEVKEVELDIDAGNAVGKLTMQVSIIEIVKLPTQRRHVNKPLGLDEDYKDPPIMLQNIHVFKTNLGHGPCLLTLAINKLLLHNCMLGFGAVANIMPLKVMDKLELEITRPFKIVCGFDSRSILVYGFIKDLKVTLACNTDISVLMDVAVIGIPDVWGMLLSRKRGASIGG